MVVRSKLESEAEILKFWKQTHWWR